MSEAGIEQKYVKEAFDTNWVVPMGPNVNAFEKDLEAFANSKSNGTEPLDRKVVCLSAGTAAVHLALIGCGVKAGDEVLVQSFTFCASSHPITYLGAKPVFVGSEGGFEESEALFAKENGIALATLGKRILRTETAPLAALSAIMCLTGNMD